MSGVEAVQTNPKNLMVYPLVNLHKYGKSPFFMGIVTLSDHYQWLCNKLPEGTPQDCRHPTDHQLASLRLAHLLYWLAFGCCRQAELPRLSQWLDVKSSRLAMNSPTGVFHTRNVGSRTRSSQIQTLAWNKLKGKSLQLAFRWWKVVKDVHFLVLLKI